MHAEARKGKHRAERRNEPNALRPAVVVPPADAEATPLNSAAAMISFSISLRGAAAATVLAGAVAGSVKRDAAEGADAAATDEAVHTRGNVWKGA